MAAQMNLSQCCTALGFSHTQLAEEVSKMSGLHITRTLITDLCHYKFAERPAIAAPKAQAIAKFVSKELGRPVSYMDLGLKVV